MKIQRLSVILTVINLALLAFLLAQTRLQIGAQGVRVSTNFDGSVLRGRALEIIDDQGRTRAAINLHAAVQAASSPDTVILRLVDPNGRPSVKLSTSERGGLLASPCVAGACLLGHHAISDGVRGLPQSSSA